MIPDDYTRTVNSFIEAMLSLAHAVRAMEKGNQLLAREHAVNALEELEATLIKSDLIRLQPAD